MSSKRRGMKNATVKAIRRLQEAKKETSPKAEARGRWTKKKARKKGERP